MFVDYADLFKKNLDYDCHNWYENGDWLNRPEKYGTVETMMVGDPLIDGNFGINCNFKMKDGVDMYKTIKK